MFLRQIITINIPVKITAKLYVNFQHNIKYRNYANKAVKAATFTRKLIHVYPNVTTVN